ncbi:hypothetical protein F5X68DRAFT_258452 [Plectosphaerella plurivora]|uniref:F-box domain-containing protein n=1 Tax=Plectosphaerella plurivora TaxID=936078 RepID=A0A9P8VIV1_9PEZI|nr:hypothetical protein F5X68DRAFT_258452 [Plectosphaerella plurivora]
MNTVLSTPELLEGILLAADIVTLLTKCQLVCRGWHDAIQTSPSLQRHLFFLSEPSAKASGPPRKNKLLERKFSFMFGDLPDDGVVSRESFEDLEIVEHRDAFVRPVATWRRMHISQPGTQLVARPTGEGTEHDTDEALWRMGDLYDYMFEYLFRNRVAYLRIWWGVLPQEGIGLPGHDYAIHGDQRDKAREDLEKLFHSNNQIVMVRRMTAQCSRGVKNADLVFQERFSMT